MPKPLILEAFDGTNKRVPVWFMRQAGRYLPEYQAIKKKYSLEKMFSTPELAAEITCLPVHILGVDAAILFADILTLPLSMGFRIDFDDKEGPVIVDTIPKVKSLEHVHDIDSVPHIVESIRLCKEKLPSNIPLIGFAGSPFTVLSYLIEGGSSIQFSKTLRFIFEHPIEFKELMERLTTNTITYLNVQKKAGIDLFQLFDTWAGILRPADYAKFCLPYVERIFSQVKLPSIYYVKNCSHLLPLMDRSKADFLSVCHTVVLGHQTTIDKTKKGVQGNLFTGLLYADEATLKKEVKDVLLGGSKHGRYIFNLSHGVLPDVKPDVLKSIVEQIHSFSITR